MIFNGLKNQFFSKKSCKKFGNVIIISDLYSVIKIRDMRTMNEKAITYLESNPIVKNFIEKVNAERKEYYEKAGMPNQYKEIVMEVGNKFLRLWCESTCWGFISRVDGDLKGSPIKKGDLLKAATWKAPAKHARGNILDNTARYGVYGPEYL